MQSVVRTVELAPDAEGVIVNGMANWRSDDRLNEGCLHRIEAMEAAVGRPVIAPDTTLHWAPVSFTGGYAHPRSRRPAGRL